MAHAKFTITGGSAWMLALLAGLPSCQTPSTPSSATSSPQTVFVSDGPSLPEGRGGHAAGIVQGQIIVAGGASWNEQGTEKTFHADCVIYDRDHWRSGPKLPAPFAEGAYACDDNALYLAGGLRGIDQPSDQVYRITRADDRWLIKTLSPLPRALTSAAGAIQNNTLFLACGEADGKATNELWSLDLSHPQAHWIRQAPLPGPVRSYPALAACGGSLYLLGGLSDQSGGIRQRTLGDFYRYDPTADQWTLLGNLPAAGYCWSTAAVDDSHLLLTGRADGEIHDDLWLVDLRALSAKQVGRTIIQTTCAALVEAAPGQWWLIGGEPDANRHRTGRVSIISLSPGTAK